MGGGRGRESEGGKGEGRRGLKGREAPWSPPNSPLEFTFSDYPLRLPQ